MSLLSRVTRTCCVLTVLIGLIVLEYPNLAAQPGGGRGRQPGQPGGNPWGGQGGQGQPGGQGGQAQPGQAGNGAGLGTANDYFNLGPIGLMGMPTAEGIQVKLVEDGGRAQKAGLKVGDVIVGADGKGFKSGANHIDEYAAAFDSVEESKDAKLELTLSGDRKISVELKKTGKHSDNGPGDKSDEAFRLACKYLAAKQQSNGSWYTQLGGTNGVVVVTSLAAMVLISSGEKEYQSNIDKAAEFVMAKAGVMNDMNGWPGRQQFDAEALEKMARARMKAQGMSDAEIDAEIEKYKKMLNGGQLPGGGQLPPGFPGGGNNGGGGNANPGGSGNPWNNGGNGGGNNNGGAGDNGAGPDGEQNPTDPGSGGQNWDQTNWGLSYGSWFVACWHENKFNAKAKESLQKWADKLIENQVKGEEAGAYSKGGGWAHSPASMGTNPLDYLELEIMSNYALAALAFADKAGCKVDKKAIKAGQAYIADCTTPRGGVSYSTRVGQYPGTAEPGRTCGALFAMTASGADSGLLDRMGGYAKTHVDRTALGHGSPTMHMLGGALGNNAAGPANWKAFWERWRLTIMLARCEDGRFRSFPTAESQQIGNTDITVGDIWTTANIALILGLQKGHVPLLQGKKRGSSVAPDPDRGAETTDNGSNNGGGSADPAEKPIRYPKGTDEYDKFMNLLSMCVPRGHRALKADSVTEAVEMLSASDKAKMESLCNRMSRNATGSDKDLLREFRDMVSE